MIQATEFDQLSRAARLLSGHVDELQHRHVSNLQVGASNTDVVGLQTCAMATTFIIVGLVGCFEGRLQARYGGDRAYDQLDAELRKVTRDDLADSFQHYRKAVNVLKHGEGASYEALLRDRAALPFPVRGKGEAFFEEGDVSEVGGLIHTGGDFTDRCVRLIEEIRGVLAID